MAPASAIKSAAFKKLKEDWLAENSDAREEGTTRWQLNQQIANAKQRSQANPEDMDKMLDLAAAYGVLDPYDKRCLNVCEKMEALGIQAMDTQRQGEFYQLLGRSLFLCERPEESLRALRVAQICFKEKGNKQLRRANNQGLLRVYSALGRSKECAERLEVALTLCENSDDGITLYMSAKGALEQTGVARDAEVLDDIWYVFLEEHPEERRKWEEYNSMGTSLCRQFGTSDDAPPPEEMSWADHRDRLLSLDTWREVMPQVIEDCKKSVVIRTLLMLSASLMVMYVFLVAMVAAKGQR